MVHNARVSGLVKLCRALSQTLSHYTLSTHSIPHPPSSLQVPKIRAIKRSTVGSRNAQWARMHQLIPGIVYGFDAEGRDTVELVYVKESDLRKEVNKRGRSFTNTLFDIELDGKVQRVLPRDFQIHPFKPKAISINWLRYRVGAYPGVRLDIPLKAFNQERCPAFKEGGWLLELQRKVGPQAMRGRLWHWQQGKKCTAQGGGSMGEGQQSLQLRGRQQLVHSSTSSLDACRASPFILLSLHLPLPSLSLPPPPSRSCLCMLVGRRFLTT